MPPALVSQCIILIYNVCYMYLQHPLITTCFAGIFRSILGLYRYVGRREIFCPRATGLVAFSSTLYFWSTHIYSFVIWWSHRCLVQYSTGIRAVFFYKPFTCVTITWLVTKIIFAGTKESFKKVSILLINKNHSICIKI